MIRPLFADPSLKCVSIFMTQNQFICIINDGRDGDEDEQVDVWCLHEERKTEMRMSRLMGGVHEERKTEIRVSRLMCGVYMRERQR